MVKLCCDRGNCNFLNNLCSWLSPCRVISLCIWVTILLGLLLTTTGLLIVSFPIDVFQHEGTCTVLSRNTIPSYMYMIPDQYTCFLNLSGFDKDMSYYSRLVYDYGCTFEEGDEFTCYCDVELGVCYKSRYLTDKFIYLSGAVIIFILFCIVVCLFGCFLCREMSKKIVRTKLADMYLNLDDCNPCCAGFFKICCSWCWGDFSSSYTSIEKNKLTNIESQESLDSVGLDDMDDDDDEEKLLKQSQNAKASTTMKSKNGKN